MFFVKPKFQKSFRNPGFTLCPDRKIGIHHRHHEKLVWFLKGLFPVFPTTYRNILKYVAFWGPMPASQLRPHHQLEKFSSRPPQVLFYACAQFGLMFQRKRFHIETWIEFAGFRWLVGDLYNRNWCSNFIPFGFPCANPWHQTLNCSRMTLVECGFFGLDADEPFQRHLDEAYKHFKAFVASRKIQCSQGPFKEKMVPWMVFIILIYLWLGPSSNK